MSETFYDPQSRKLVIGDAAVESMNSGTEMGDYDFEDTPIGTDSGAVYLPTLGDVLTDQHYTAERSVRGRGTTSYSKEDVIASAAWLYEHLKVSGTDRLNRTDIQRLHDLGLGPSYDTTLKQTGGMWALRQTIGTTDNSHKIENVKNWSTRDWREYAEDIANSLPDGPRKPSHQDYVEASKDGRGPSAYSISLALGGTAMLNELAGYVDTTVWSKNEILDWATKVIEQNPNHDNPLTKPFIRELSHRGVGPSNDHINSFFNGAIDFQEQAKRHAESLNKQRDLDRHQMLKRFDEIIHNAPRSDDHQDDNYDSYTDQQKQKFVAQYDVALGMLGAERAKRAWTIAHLTTGHFIFESGRPIYQQQRKHGFIENTSRQQVEDKIDELGVRQFIEPSNPFKGRLTVTDQQLEQQRIRNRGGKRDTTTIMDPSPNTHQQSGGGSSVTGGSAIHDVKVGLSSSIESATLSGDSLQDMQRKFDDAYYELIRVTEGSSQDDVADAAYKFRDAADKAKEAAALVRSAIQAAEQVRNRL